MLLFLDNGAKPKTPTQINKLISAELPDPEDKVAYEAVTQFMIHGPCGDLNSRSPCMLDNKCSRHYPKAFCSETSIDHNNFTVYRRRNNGHKVTVKVFDKTEELDNRWVIPHNVDLCVKFQAHINVEHCNKARSIKYLFKYINKGKDRATAIIVKNVATDLGTGKQTIRDVDEVEHFLDCRYLSASEACWRLLNFEIQYRSPSVERLPFHLEGEQMVYYSDKDLPEEVIERENVSKTKFTEWLKANAMYPSARELTYMDFPTKWVWQTKSKEWTPRKGGGKKKIGRVYYAHPTSGERFYLRILINIVKGPRSFEEIRTVNGTTYPTFKAACQALGLLDDDSEWDDALKEASGFQSPKALRELFVTLMLKCEISFPEKLWEKHHHALGEDILYLYRRNNGNQTLNLSEEKIKNYTLCEIENIMLKRGKTLATVKDFPFLDMKDQMPAGNKINAEELDYNCRALRDEYVKLHEALNTEQREVFQSVTEAVYSQNGGVFFVYGNSGTGKTYLYKTIISKLRSEGKIVLAVASSGIASLLLPGGRTAHSRFNIQIPTNEDSTCNISKHEALAKLIQKADLILWDEAPMTHRHGFEAVDRTLKDIMDEETKRFGGKTFLMGGDFRQILLVIPRGKRGDIVDASINRSKIWEECKVFHLTQNMRLQNDRVDPKTVSSIEDFSKWVLDLGDGNLPAIAMENDIERTWIQIPEDLLIPESDDSIQDIVSTIYPDFAINHNSVKYLKERSILAPKNETVDEINSYIISSLPGDLQSYLSADSLCPIEGKSAEQDILYPIEFLNTLQFSGVPNHNIELKVGVPIMLMRNLNQSAGLCNGTRLIVTRLGSKVIEAKIITGSNIGDPVYIPRIILSLSDTKWPFVFKRKQFPIRVCYAMTINKSQGQTFNHVGVYLPRPIFTHGQLYVAVSRTTSRQGLKFLIKSEDDEPKGYTQNIVYKEVFQAI